jgi:4-amino-4-deoxy-L-arabinose transferase-like glycosyltransferase
LTRRLTARVWLALAGVIAARMAYQVWLSPYELVADEAQDWDWSRRLSASYYSKGPGIAWLIRASTAVLGISEWSVRLPAAIAFFVTSAVAARLAAEWSPPERSERAAMIAIALVTLLPAFQLSALLMTIDAPYIACWALALWAAWTAYGRERDAQPSSAVWIACGAAIGVGFLFKYSILLLVPGLAAFAWAVRGVARDGVAVRIAWAGVAIAICVSPVVWWNVQHEFAGVRHLLGYLEVAGGDRGTRTVFTYRPQWTVSLLLGQLAVVGPMLGLMVLAIVRGRRGGLVHARFAAGTAAPILIAFLLVTFRAPAEINWPIAAYTSLIPIAASLIAFLPDRSILRWWRATIVYGAVAALAIHLPLAAARLPLVGRFVPTTRFHGFADRAQELSSPIRAFAAHADGGALIVAPSHNMAGLLAFYLPGRPAVASAGRYFGDRPSAYDFFPDTDLTSAATHDRPAILLGRTADSWRAGFFVGELTLLSMDGPQFAASAFGGPRSDGASAPPTVVR